mgnify:CR=1 FL=1
MSRTWIRDPLAIYADNAERGFVVENQLITELIPAGKAPTAPVDTTFDASSHVVLPGLINTHHHFYQTLTRSLRTALNKELFDWLGALYPVWAHLDPEMLAAATELALAELLRTIRRDQRDWTILIARNRDLVEERALAAACNKADIVIADRLLPYSCRPDWLKADRRFLDREGGAAIYLASERIDTVAQDQGEHGWWRAPDR